VQQLPSPDLFDCQNDQLLQLACEELEEFERVFKEEMSTPETSSLLLSIEDDDRHGDNEEDDSLLFQN